MAGLPPNEKMEQFVENEEDCYKMSEYELEKYYLVKKEESLYNEGSSSMDTDDDIFYKCGKYQYMTVIASDNFPPYSKKRENYALKDVVKDYVLPFLPAKTLVRFKSVAKDWDRWIENPFFALQQSYSFQKLSGFFCQYDEWKNTFVTLNHDSYGVPTPSLTFLPELVSIISSSGGLLLCQGNQNSYYVCNPATEDWKSIPNPKYYHGSDPAIVLVFEPSLLNMEAHYQLICAVPLLTQSFVSFEIYSSETRSWTVSPTICTDLEDLNFTDNRFFMNGIVYWETSTRKVLAFDLKNEIYGINSLDSDIPLGGVLTKMHDELCYIGISNRTGGEYAIKIYGGVDLRLKREIDVNLGVGLDEVRGYRVLPCVDDDVVMVLAGNFVYSCTMSDGRVELVSNEGVDSWDADRYLPYVNSLVQVS